MPPRPSSLTISYRLESFVLIKPYRDYTTTRHGRPVTSELLATGFWARLRRWWVAGILVLAPTALTAWVVWRLFRFFDDILGVELRQRGISVVGLGFVLLNALLLLLGFVATNFLGRRAFALWDRLMHRVPLINKI